jgi:hypothetical protein
MDGTDMVAWIDDGTANAQQDLYSVKEQSPTILPSTENTYTTQVVSTNSTYTVFDSTRPLTPTGTDGDTYVIPLDETFSTVWAFEATNRLRVQYHNGQRGTILMTLPSTGGCFLGEQVATRYQQATLHGVLMWFCWSVISLGQLYTNRYAKHWWKYRHTIHNVLGLLSGVLTVASIIIILNWIGWTFYFDQYHNVAGLVFMILCLLLILGGIFN